MFPRKVFATLISTLALSWGAIGRPELGTSVSAGPGVGSKSFNDPLKVKGETRNLNMKLMLRGKEDAIKFIKIRKNYHQEIADTTY